MREFIKIEMSRKVMEGARVFTGSKKGGAERIVAF